VNLLPRYFAIGVVGFGVRTLFIEPDSPWENGYIESFNGKLRNELLNREIFTTLLEAKILIEEWRKEYKQIRPRSSMGYRPPAPAATLHSYALNTTLSVVQRLEADHFQIEDLFCNVQVRLKMPEKN
jgi:hypothetical protein